MHSVKYSENRSFSIFSRKIGVLGSFCSFLTLFLLTTTLTEASSCTPKISSKGSNKVYANLQTAIDRAADGDTLTIQGRAIANGTPFVINKNLTLKGHHDAVLDGNAASQVVVVNGVGIRVILQNLTITNARSATEGGGIYNGPGSNLLLRKVTVERNTGETLGAGIYNAGILTLAHSKIYNNVGESDGAGIYNAAGAQLIGNHTKIIYNISTAGNGGGLYVVDGNQTLNDSEVGHNIAVNGGGIYNNLFATTTCTDVKISDNRANNGGGVFNEGDTIFVNCYFHRNVAYFAGGGLLNVPGTPSTASFLNSDIKENVAGSGGGIFNGAGGTYTIPDTKVHHNKPNNIVNQPIPPA